MSKHENKNVEANIDPKARTDYKMPSNQWRLIFKNVGQDFYTGWLPNYIVTIVFILCAPAIGLLMNTPKAIIFGVASGITIAVWAIAYIMVRHIPTPPQTTEVATQEKNVNTERSNNAKPAQPNPPKTKQQSKPLPKATQKSKLLPEATETERVPSSSTTSTKDVAFIGNIIFADGKETKACKIWDHNPGPIGSGWNEGSVGYCSNLEAACNHDTNRSRKFPYSRIQRIDVLPLTITEKQIVDGMYYYDKDKLIKCNVTFHDGSIMNTIFLLPHYLRYECANETGSLTRDTIKTLIFSSTK